MIDNLRVGVARGVGVTRLPTHMVDAAVTLAHLERFCRAASQALGTTVEPVQTRSYTELLRKLDECEIDLGWLPPVVALHAQQVGLASPVLAPVRGGSSTFHAVLFARASSSIHGPTHLDGKRVAWVDRESAAGYAVIRAALRATGHDPARLFAAESFEGSHQAVVQAVMDGTADVGATYLHRDERGQLASAGWGSADARAVFEHGPIPADVLAASAEADPAVVARIVDAVLAASELHAAACELFEAESFVRVGSGHLDPLRALVDHFDDAVGHP